MLLYRHLITACSACDKRREGKSWHNVRWWLSVRKFYKHCGSSIAALETIFLMKASVFSECSKFNTALLSRTSGWNVRENPISPKIWLDIRTLIIFKEFGVHCWSWYVCLNLSLVVWSRMHIGTDSFLPRFKVQVSGLFVSMYGTSFCPVLAVFPPMKRSLPPRQRKYWEMNR